jgi:hypothetical protein
VRQGQTPEKKGEPILYYGKVLRVPHGADLTQMLADADPGTLLEDLPDCEYVPGGFIEHYELYDRETNELVIVWRVPFREKKSNATHSA